MNIPSTREEAINILVDQDVAKWGETEREASRRLHERRTYGLALTELYARAELNDEPDTTKLKAAAKAARTADDDRFLRNGG